MVPPLLRRIRLSASQSGGRTKDGVPWNSKILDNPMVIINGIEIINRKGITVDHQRTVFLAILGESPGVLTETLWAMITQNSKDVPDLISVMTTRKGREILQRDVFDTGAWEKMHTKLCPGRPFPFPEIVRLPQRDSAEEMVDVMSRADVERAGDHMLRWVRSFAAEPGTRIIASISGGRKSMTMLFTTCMTLLGKSRDRMYHVHVPHPYDTPLTPPFLFPGATEHHQTLAGQCVSGEQVPITLIEMPFIPLHALYENYWGQTPPPLSEMIGALQQRIEKSHARRVALHRRKKIVKLEQNEVSLSDVELRVLEYLWGLKTFPAGWGELPEGMEMEDTRKAADRIRQKMKKAGVPFPEIIRLLPRFRSDPRPQHWPPKNLRIL